MPAVDIRTRPVSEIEADLANLAPKHAELRTRIKAGKATDAMIQEQRDALSAIYDLDAEHKIASLVESINARGTGPQGATLTPGAEVRSAGQLVEADEQFRQFAERGGRGNVDIEVRNLLTSDAANSPKAGLFAPVGQPVLVNRRMQRLFVRDVMNVVQTGLNSVPYIRELNALANETGASSVSEAAAKPEVTMEFTRDDAPIRKIAGWIRATTEELADAPLVRGYIDTRLAYMVALREEQQVLNGSGTSPQLRGILNTSGVQTQTFATDEAITIGKAIGKVELVDGYPNAVALNPVDFWDMVTRRSANQFDGAAIGNAPFGTPTNTIWGLTAVRTRSIATDTALVGDFLQGATLLDREQTSIRVGDQHSDYFTSNLVAILAEERIGLAVHRPDFFVSAALA